MHVIETVDLPDVTLSVAVHGEGPLIIAAHGFPDCARTFDAQVPALVAAGYRVAVPTLRGYAPSGLPRSGRYDLMALGADLVALADHYAPREPVRLLGHDWGAAASYVAAALAPDRIAAVASLAVPHFRAFLGDGARPAQLRRSWYIGFFQIRGVADAALRARDLALVERLWRAWSPGWTPSRGEMEAVKAALRDRVGPALGYYRALPVVMANASWRRILLAPTTVPVLRLHGEDDGCVGAEIGADEARLHTARFEKHVIPRAGHFLHRERPEEINRRVTAFFAG